MKAIRVKSVKNICSLNEIFNDTYDRYNFLKPE